LEETMKIPWQTTSAATLHDAYGLYHLTRLKADPRCSDLAAAFQTAQDRLKARLDQAGVARAAAMTALTVRDAKNGALGQEVRAFALAILARAGGDYQAPLYQTYFSTGMHAVITAPLRTELTAVGAILAKLKEETNPSLASFFEQLQAAAEAMRSALSAHRTARGAEANASGLLRAEAIHWTDAYRGATGNCSFVSIRMATWPNRSSAVRRRGGAGRKTRRSHRPAVRSSIRLPDQPPERPSARASVPRRLVSAFPLERPSMPRPLMPARVVRRTFRL
jgi:hypothetical protein